MASRLGLLALFATVSCTRPPHVERGAAAPPRGEAGELDALCFGQRQGVSTHALVLERAGRTLYARYAGDEGNTKKHRAWSVTKSVFAAWVVWLEKEGAFSLRTSVCDAYPEAAARDLRFCRLTARELLGMSSGLAWREDYGEDPASSSVLQMLYGEGVADMPEYVIRQGFESDPGVRWRYSSGDPVLLSGIVRRSLGDAKYRTSFFHDFLPTVGMANATVETDAAGNLVASSYLQVTSAELARFGAWLEGELRAPRSLPADWATRALLPVAEMSQVESKVEPQESYGWGFWLNRPVQAKHGRPWPNAPEDAFAALGHLGQKLFVIPSEKLVVVRLGEDLDGYLDNDELLAASVRFAHGVRASSPGPPSRAAMEEVPSSAAASKAPRMPETMAAQLAAKEACTCLFVHDSARDVCRRFLERVTPATWRAETGARVTVATVGDASARAAFRDVRTGCALE